MDGEHRMRMAEMLLFLQENPDWQQAICGFCEADTEAILTLAKELRKHGFYEFLMVLLLKNRIRPQVERALLRYLTDMWDAERLYAVLEEELTG